MKKLLALLLLFVSLPSWATITISPPFLTAGSTGVTLNVVASGVGSAVACPMTVSGGTLAITACNVVDSTHATLTVNAGNVTPTGAVITDPQGDSYTVFVFSLDHDTVASGLALVNPASTGGTLDSGALTDNCSPSCWGVASGSVLSLPLSNQGSYSVAPSVVVAARNGTFPSGVQAAATAVVSGGVLATPLTLTNAGRDYASLAAPTFSGGTGSGAVAGAPVLTGHLIQTAGGTCSSSAFGAQCQLLRPAAVNTLNQMVDVKYEMTATTDKPTLVLRWHPSGPMQGYSCQVNVGLTCFYLNNYTSGSAPIVLTASAAAVPVGHEVHVMVSATGANPTTLHAYVYDVTAATVLVNAFATDSTAAAQTAGQVGVGYVGSIQAIEEIATYTGGLTASPNAVNLNSSGQSISLICATCSWTPGTPGTPTFTTGSGCSITGQTISGAGAATLTMSFGASAGTCTINDPSSGLTGAVSMTPIQPPQAVMGSLPSGGAANVKASGAATFANFPATYSLYRSPNINFNPQTDPQAVLVSTQSGVGSGVPPTAVNDSSVPAGQWFYSWLVTDSSAQAVYGLDGRTVYPATWPGGNIGVIGDSISVGHATTAFIQRIVDPVVVSGSGYASAPTCTVSGGGTAPLGGLVTVHVTAGAIDYAYPTDQAYETGYASEASPAACALSGGGGTGGSVTLNSGGGWPLAMQQILRTQYNLRGVYVLQPGRGGTAASSWQPGSALLNRAYAMFGSPSQTPLVLIDFGANDANGSVPVSTWITYMENIITDLTNNGYRVGVIPPMFNGQANQATNALIQGYGQAIPGIVALYPGKAYEVGAYLYQWSVLNNPAMFADQLHPNDAGAGAIGGIVARDVVPLMQLSIAPPGTVFH